MSQENINAVHRLFEEAWNKRNIGAVDHILKFDYRRHDPSTPDMGIGSENYKRIVELYTSAFPDLQLTIEDIVDSGDKLAVRWTAIGTHEGPLNEIAPTRKKVSIRGMSIFLFEDGMVQEEWLNWDALGMLQQFGVVPQTFKTAKAA
jgi:steroid delta-isomerase-like uncharacterized protein